jgi:hypothetical protein
MTVEEIAQEVHGIERMHAKYALREDPQPIWAESSEHHRESVKAHVTYALENPEASPGHLYEAWNGKHANFKRLTENQRKAYALFRCAVDLLAS